MLNRSTVNKSFNPYGKETATFQTKAYYVTDIGAIYSISTSINLCFIFFVSYYKSIINYDPDIANVLVISPQIRYIEVFDLTNPRFNKQIWSVPSDFVKWRFHCISGP